MPSLAGTYQQGTRFPMPDPTIIRLDTEDGPIWEVSGLGMVTRHRQLWQAELFWVFMCTATGFNSPSGREDDRA